MGDESGEAAVKIEMSGGLQLKEAEVMVHKRDRCAPEGHRSVVESLAGAKGTWNLVNRVKLF